MLSYFSEIVNRIQKAYHDSPFDLPAKVILMTGPHPECQRRIRTRNEGAGKASS